MPPRDRFILRSVRSVNEPPDGEDRRSPADDAETLLDWIDRVASCGGGWLPLVFHHLRDDCAAEDAPAAYCFDYAELDRLAQALAGGERCPSGDGARCFGVQVATVSAVVGQGEPAPAPEVPGLRNPSLERTLDSGQTECIRRTGDSDTATFSRSSLAHSGGASERLELFGSGSVSAELGVERDYGECATFARPGRRYELSLHYRADPDLDTPQLRFVTYRLRADYVWVPWQSGAAFEARSPGDWVRLALGTEPVPPDTLAISFGLRQESAGAINLDDLDSIPLGSVDGE